MEAFQWCAGHTCDGSIGVTLSWEWSPPPPATCHLTNFSHQVQPPANLANQELPEVGKLGQGGGAVCSVAK